MGVVACFAEPTLARYSPSEPTRVPVQRATDYGGAAHLRALNWCLLLQRLGYPVLLATCVLEPTSAITDLATLLGLRASCSCAGGGEHRYRGAQR